MMIVGAVGCSTLSGVPSGFQIPPALPFGVTGAQQAHLNVITHLAERRARKLLADQDRRDAVVLADQFDCTFSHAA